MKPTISVILPTYNRASLVGRAIKSVIGQTFKDWELIVIDDASTDNTKTILEDWKNKDQRIRVIRNEKNSYPDISKILNDGIKAATGKYIARLDDDDYWCDPRKLERQVEFLENHPDYVIVGSGMILIDGEGKQLYRYLKKEKDEEIRRNALFANPFSHTTVVFDREAALSVGGYGPWRYIEDWEFWLRLGMKGKMYNLPNYLTAYLLAGQNKTFIHQRAQSKEILRSLWLHRKDYPRFWLGFSLNFLQFIYSLLPAFIRKRMHNVLAFWKRQVF